MMEEKIVFVKSYDITKDKIIFYYSLDYPKTNSTWEISEILYKEYFHYLDYEEIREVLIKYIKEYVIAPLEDIIKNYRVKISEEYYYIAIPKRFATRQRIQDILCHYRMMFKKVIKKLCDLNKKRKEELEDVVEGEDKIEIEIQDV